MNFSVSMHDDLFHAVEHAAKRLRISRSELLSRAAAAFLLDERCDREVTESYNRAFGPGEPSAVRDEGMDRFHREATRRALLDVEW